MCTEINKNQCDINLAYHGQIYLRENIIRVCQGHLTLAAGLTNPPPKISDIINSLYNSIINYEAVHKPSSTENYVQFETNWDENEMLFTDRQYQ